jgi:thiamine-monophosphate kinase
MSKDHRGTIGSEAELIAALAAIFQSGADAKTPSDLIVDIGDDAAIIQTSGDLMALSSDLLTEGTHFKMEFSDLYSIGKKAAVANLADIFAMGIRPRFFLVSVAFDERFLYSESSKNSILQLARGIHDQAHRFGVRVIGGDIARSDRLTISITALGSGSKKVTRSGAKPGDGLFITQLPGKSFLGLDQLRKGLEIDSESITHHLAPEVDFEKFFAISESATALSDISDGLISEASHIARASGVDINIESAALKSHPEFEKISEVAKRLGIDPIVAITESGEEHFPVFTSRSGEQSKEQSKNESDLIRFKIGDVLAQSGESPRVMLDFQEVSKSGFSHF